jgi:hypothetical protein
MNQSPDHQHGDRRTARPEAPISVAEAEVAHGACCRASDDDEPLGGDPPCWAHLFEDDDLKPPAP